jgi:bacillithiol system protein YtxJ
MNWTELTTDKQLKDLVEKSLDKPQVIFKHSTRCSISSVIKTRLETGKIPEDIDFHYLDLIAYRSLSNKIAADLDVYHQSPQVLLIQNGKCIFDESHLVIRMQDILSFSGRSRVSPMQQKA